MRQSPFGQMDSNTNYGCERYGRENKNMYLKMRANGCEETLTVREKRVKIGNHL